MPEKKTLQEGQKARAEGKAPSTAGRDVRAREMEHVKEG
jgi:hypothetical protein